MATRKQKSEARTATLKDRGSAYKLLAGTSERARMMSQVEEFRIVPTEFTSFNRASTVGGAPLSCIWLVHGPSMGGKTAFLLGLIRAFQRAKGLSSFIDAEMSADTKSWFPALGVDLDDCLYVGRTDEDEDPEPLTYEQIVEEVDAQLANFQAAKKDRKIPRSTPMIVVVDSVSKMVPASLMKALDKDGGKALRGGVGRIQALLNTAWLAELGTKVGDDNILMALIAHERDKEEKGYGTDYVVRGGGSLVYDAMMQVRVEFAGLVKDLSADEAPAVGKRHRVKIIKNKHGPGFKFATFYTSTGEGVCPKGFDRVREVVHEGILRGTIQGPNVAKDGKLTLGSKLEWKGRKIQLKQLYSAAEIVESMAHELDAGLLKDGRSGKDDAP